VSFNRASLLALALLLSLTACQKESEGPPPRYAIARFANLSGDPSLDWVGRAAPAYLTRTLLKALDGPVLTSRALNRAAGAGISDDRAQAQLAGATHLLSGYIEKVNGKLRLYSVDEDLNTHQNARTLAVEAAQPLPALNGLAHAFSPSAAPYLTSNPEALRLYSSALDEPLDRALADLRAAVQIDPAFGPAWASLIDYTSLRNDRSLLASTIEEALNKPLAPLDKAQIQLEKTLLDKDMDARLAAMRDLSQQTPADLALIKSLAESGIAAGRFAQAAADWKRLRDTDPNDRDAWNQLGYALAWSGDFPAALNAMKQYAARWPEDPNALDSAGDVYYMYGEFPEAAAWYLKANDKGPQLLAGGDFYKAAWAYFRAGEKAKANAAFEQFRAVRTKSTPAGFPLFEADWLFRTGREKQAIALLRKEDGYRAELVLQELLAGDRAAAAKDAAAIKQPSNLSTIARFAALPSASAAEWESRAGMLHAQNNEPARRFTLGIALLLDGKKEAALPVWEKIAEESSATDFFTQSIVEKLKGKKPKIEQVPDSLNVNPLRVVADNL
jgi:tetratricopeptide (TPR) repeat protein